MNEPSDSQSKRPAVTRREVLRLIGLSPIALAGAAEAARPQIQGPIRFRVPSQHEATAGRWRTWLIPAGSTMTLPAPPSRNSARGRSEFNELVSLQARRGDTMLGLIRYWEPQGGVPRWSQILLEKIKETRMNPVRAARAIALLHTAIADATIAAWGAKFSHNRLQPALQDNRLRPVSQEDYLLPSYPSGHAVVAAAAATVLNSLFPGQTGLVHGTRLRFDDAANEAALTRLWAGANYRSDLEAAFQLGQAIGQLAVNRGQSDGSNAVWNSSAQPGRLVGPQYWVPTPPAFAFPPLEPAAGTWKTWLLTSPSQFRPGPPPALEGVFPSARFLAEAAEVKRVVDSLTPAQLQIANFWADNAGVSYTPPGHWVEIALEQVGGSQVSTPRAARALALVGAGLADSAIACWDAKFAYWIMRPITAIRTMAGQSFHDPNFLTPVVTPPFPAYTSGHSTFSGCSATVLQYLFPGGKVADAFGQRVSFDAAADQAAISRLYGGIHYTSDNNEGLTCGRQIADLVINRGRGDGAP